MTLTKFTIFLTVSLTLLFLVCAVCVLTGHGDWMINNYRNLSEERRVRVNIFRLRRVTAAMLFFLAATVPADLLVQSERVQCVLGVITVIVLACFLLTARLWAGMPLFYNPFGKK